MCGGFEGTIEWEVYAMRANEFVKKFGWEIAKRTLVNADGCDFIKIHGGYEFKFDDLKRYVDAYELVHKEFESVEMADYEHMVSGCYSDPYWIKLKQAITLVEECQ